MKLEARWRQLPPPQPRTRRGAPPAWHGRAAAAQGSSSGRPATTLLPPLAMDPSEPTLGGEWLSEGEATLWGPPQQSIPQQSGGRQRGQARMSGGSSPRSAPDGGSFRLPSLQADPWSQLPSTPRLRQVAPGQLCSAAVAAAAGQRQWCVVSRQDLPPLPPPSGVERQAGRSRTPAAAAPHTAAGKPTGGHSSPSPGPSTSTSPSTRPGTALERLKLAQLHSSPAPFRRHTATGSAGAGQAAATGGVGPLPGASRLPDGSREPGGTPTSSQHRQQQPEGPGQQGHAAGAAASPAGALGALKLRRLASMAGQLTTGGLRPATAPC